MVTHVPSNVKQRRHSKPRNLGRQIVHLVSPHFQTQICTNRSVKQQTKHSSNTFPRPIKGHQLKKSWSQFKPAHSPSHTLDTRLTSHTNENQIHDQVTRAIGCQEQCLHLTDTAPARAQPSNVNYCDADAPSIGLHHITNSTSTHLTHTPQAQTASATNCVTLNMPSTSQTIRMQQAAPNPQPTD